MGQSQSTHAVAPWYWDRIDLFAGADGKARGDFMAHAKCFTFKRGQHIFRSRDRATHAFFLQSGMVKVYDLSASGTVTLFWFCLPGDILGPGAITGAPEQAVHAQVVSDATVLAIRRGDLEEVVNSNPRLAINIIRMVGSRLRLVSEMMTDAQSFRSEERLARLLLRLGQNWGVISPSGLQLPVKIPHQELASMIGSCRQTVNTILREFEKQDLIAVEARLITLTDILKLQKIAAIEAST